MRSPVLPILSLILCPTLLPTSPRPLSVVPAPFLPPCRPFSIFWTPPDLSRALPFGSPHCAWLMWLFLLFFFVLVYYLITKKNKQKSLFSPLSPPRTLKEKIIFRASSWYNFSSYVLSPPSALHAQLIHGPLRASCPLSRLPCSPRRGPLAGVSRVVPRATPQIRRSPLCSFPFSPPLAAHLRPLLALCRALRVAARGQWLLSMLKRVAVNVTHAPCL